MRVEQIGLATLYLGDNREIIPELSDVACIVTSPPYNQLGTTSTPSGMWKDNSFGKAATQDWSEKGYFDTLTEEGYQEEQNELFALLALSCREDASLFYNHQLRWRDGTCLHPAVWFHPSQWRLRTEIVWDRGGGMMLNARMFCRYDERILWFVRGNRWKWNQAQVGLGTVWRIPAAQNKDHPVAFPVEMPLRCIMATTDPGDIVLDPYSGSASTGVAAVQNGRRYVGIEREQKYFDAACKRVEDAQRQGSLFGEAA
jgi:site-specific DNA-methyltransferase (adenine-specific)